MGYTLRSFNWYQGKQGLTQYLYELMTDNFIPSIDDGDPTNESGLNFNGVKKISLMLHKSEGLKFGCQIDLKKLPSMINDASVINPDSPNNDCFIQCVLASNVLLTERKKVINK